MDVPAPRDRPELDRRLLPGPPDRRLLAGASSNPPGQGHFQVLGRAYEPLLAGAAVLLVYWLILFWMDRRRIYLKV